MRDLGRIKERYDFSLDSRQLGIVLFAVLVAAALIFVLGMSVGSQWEKKRSAVKTADQTETAPATLAQGQEDAMPAAPPVAPVAVKQEPPDDAAPSAEEGYKAEEPPPPEKAEKKAGAGPDTKVIKPEELTFPKVLATGGKPAASPAKAKAKAPTVSKGSYTVQVGAYKDKAAADSYAARLKKKGYSAAVHSASSSGGKVYKVHVGSFRKKEDAQRTADRLAAAEKIKTYVTTY